MIHYCPRCSKEYYSGARFCQACGYHLEPEFIENPTCPVCKTTYPPATKFCTKDGSKLLRAEDIVPKCVICHTTYPDDVKFCPKDGGQVKAILPAYSQSSSHDALFSYYDINRKYPKASLGNRFLAALLDSLISIGLAIPAMVAFIAASNKSDYENDAAAGLYVLAFLLYIIPLVYIFIKDGLGQGQSWGKRAVDLMVINLESNLPCDKGNSFFRNFISGLIGVIPFVGWLIEPIMVLATTDGRKLGDKAANTQVIDKKLFNQNNLL